MRSAPQLLGEMNGMEVNAIRPERLRPGPFQADRGHSRNE